METETTTEPDMNLSDIHSEFSEYSTLSRSLFGKKNEKFFLFQKGKINELIKLNFADKEREKRDKIKENFTAEKMFTINYKFKDLNNRFSLSVFPYFVLFRNMREILENKKLRKFHQKKDWFEIETENEQFMNFFSESKGL